MKEAPLPPDSPPSSHRLLLVDDDEIVLLALYETLRREQYEVVTATDPAKALDELRKTEFSVIVTDQRMPEMTGLELLAEARQIQPNATRILITAVLSLDTVIEAINKGEIYRFIVKPWLREELLVTIKNAIQRHDLLRQNTELQGSTQFMNRQLGELNRSLEQQVKVVEQQNQRLSGMNHALEQGSARLGGFCLHTLQAFYPVLANQTRRVMQLCGSLAVATNLPDEERRVLANAALLHDVGLLGVPRAVIRKWLEKPGSLEPVERTLIERHPILSQELAASGSGMDNAGEIIRAHHERFDGKGYPDELVGENIPWVARLLAVAVAFALSRHTHENAVEEIKMNSGSAFDPEAVRALLKALPQAALPHKEREILISDLRPGMVLARGIYTSNGLLLVPEGQQLNASYIEKLLNHNQVQPLTQSLVVYC